MTAGNQPPPIDRPDVPGVLRPSAPGGPGVAAPERPGGPPPPPDGPSRRRRYALLAAVVVVVLLAGVGYAGYRQAAGDPREGGRELTSPSYTVTVPESWAAAPPGAAPLVVYGVPFAPVAQVGAYPCREGTFTRGTVAGAQVAVPAGVSVEQAASAFARGAGEALFPGAAPQVAVGVPTPRDGGTQVEATVRTDGLGGCRATEATVLVVAQPRVTAGDGSTGAALLVVAGDTRGGPPDPAVRTRPELAGIADTATAPSGS